MVRSLATYGSTRNWLALGCFISFGCAGSHGIIPGRQIDVSADSTYDESWNTPLPSGVPSNPTVFRATVAPYLLYPGPRYLRQRAGKCNACVIWVTIKTLSNTRSLDSNQPPTPVARPVALIENLDRDSTEAFYGFKPGRQADYYWWADSDPNHPGLARLTMLEVPRFGGIVRAGRWEDIHVCQAYMHGDTPSEGADFVEYRHPEGCSRDDMSAVKQGDFSSGFWQLWSALVARVTTIINRNTMISRGGWIDCNSGCCT
jgi:hypothetical protein